MNRRRLLKLLGGAAGVTLLPVGRAGWAASFDDAPAPRRRLIVVMLRGAVDGLNVVVPYGDADYYHARGSIAIARPGADDGALDLDGHFGLHPALAPLLPLWQQKRLAFVHAAGSPDPTRSHFDAQDYMESGTPGVKTTADGWMNRLLAQLPAPHDATQALSLGPVLPRILSGAINVATVPLGRNAGKDSAFDRPEVAAAFDLLYMGDGDLARNYREGREARVQIKSGLASMQGDMNDGMNGAGAGGMDYAQEMKASANGALSANGFVLDAYQLAGLIQHDPRIQLAFTSLGGWDTHVNQGNAKGQLAGHLAPLAQGLDTLCRGLGPLLDDSVIVVMSEFGRTVHENGNRGTDHGHGNVMWLIGGGLRGGRVYGEWPTLAQDRLYQGRDLAITTDFRSVLARIAQAHLQLNDKQLAAVFPDFAPPAGAMETLFTA